MGFTKWIMKKGAIGGATKLHIKTYRNFKANNPTISDRDIFKGIINFRCSITGVRFSESEFEKLISSPTVKDFIISFVIMERINEIHPNSMPVILEAINEIYEEEMTNEKTFNVLRYASKIMLILGGVICLSGLGGNNSSVFSGGIILIFGGLASVSRRKQLIGNSKSWIILEIISIFIVIFHIVIFSFLNSGWYYYPVSFMFIPIAVLGFWFYSILLSG